MISEREIEDTLEFLHGHARKAATARANRVYMEEYRKTMKALAMGDAELAGIRQVAAQEREAYASEAYQKHLIAMRDAITVDEEYRWKMVAAQAKIEAWRTMNANERVQARIG